MIAEIITIGDEILIGQTVDTNSAWMAERLNKVGIDVYQITSVSDDKSHITAALDEAIGRSEIVFITGGLGPTKDDITKHTLADYFHTRLVFNEEVFNQIQQLLSKRDIVINDRNRKQAEVPENCKIIPNELGTAPGLWFEKEQKIIVSMPGVPYEMKNLMEKRIIPQLQKRVKNSVILHRTLMTAGTFEAHLAELLENFEEQLPPGFKLAYLPSAGIIKLRLTTKGKSHDVLQKEMEKQIGLIRKSIAPYLYSEHEELLEEYIGNLLKKNHKTLSVAESCTGGNIAHMITLIPGSSAYFKGGVVAYSNSVKHELLDVQMEDILQFGAVSEEVVLQMVQGVRKKFSTDYAIAVSGIAGPEVGTETKPVGTTWIAVDSASGSSAVKFIFGNERQVNIRRASLTALNLLRKRIFEEMKKM